jgi:hypothetical protein
MIGSGQAGRAGGPHLLRAVSLWVWNHDEKQLPRFWTSSRMTQLKNLTGLGNPLRGYAEVWVCLELPWVAPEVWRAEGWSE